MEKEEEKANFLSPLSAEFWEATCASTVEGVRRGPGVELLGLGLGLGCFTKIISSNVPHSERFLNIHWLRCHKGCRHLFRISVSWVISGHIHTACQDSIFSPSRLNADLLWSETVTDRMKSDFCKQIESTYGSFKWPDLDRCFSVGTAPNTPIGFDCPRRHSELNPLAKKQQ